MPEIRYFKRYRMERTLARLPAVPPLPAGFSWRAWHPDLAEAHALVTHLSFAGEIDSEVFPSFATRAGCRAVMDAIRARVGFCPRGTWLVVADGPDQAGGGGECGTIQSVVDKYGTGAVQNVGVVPPCRGLGLGRALLLAAMHGFRSLGLRRACLEVTARNEAAVGVYRRLGFRCYKTVYRAVEARGEAPLASPAR